LTRVAVFFVVVTLLVGVAGCGNGGGDGDYYYDLTVASTVGGSVIEPGEGDFDYAANTTVDLVAEADEHYHFVNWTGDVATIGNVASAATNITMYSGYSITANFELDPGCYSLTISGEGGSVITPGEGTFGYVANTTVDLVAEPDEGYPFLKWAGDVGTIADVQAAATNITMYDSYSITAHFGIQIWDWYGLDAMHDNLGGRYYLMTDIDSTAAGYEQLVANSTDIEGKGWLPIGDSKDTAFNGTLDGQGYKIRDMFIYRPTKTSVGLFGYLGEGGIIRNISMLNADVEGESEVGGLVGQNQWGSVSNSYFIGNVTGEFAVGGLAGLNVGTVRDSHFIGNVTVDQIGGGLVGENEGGTVKDSYSSSNVHGLVLIGGLVGHIFGGTVNNCYSTGSVAGYGGIGGLVGYIGWGTVSKSYSTGSVTGGNVVGGLVGAMSEDGFSSIISYSYSTGNVTGDSHVGGLVGSILNDESTVHDSYSTGSVTGSDTVGGLVAKNQGTVTNSFWNIQTSGQATSDGGTGKTTGEMQSIATFSAWNIIAVGDPGTRNPVYIWNIVDDETYPFLSWQP
jgi:hypothetical protein